MTRARKILAALRKSYPDARCALRHRNAYELLAATILSAQCTDARVNQVTPALFAAYPTPEALARARPASVRRLVRSTGFFRNKTRSLLGAARTIVSEFGGRVPETMEELVRLPGVARKTANVILGTWFGKNEGVVVDTHVHRLSRRMAFSEQEDPVKVERDLMKLIPRRAWTEFGHLMIHHGRRVCAARKPRCGECPINRLCPSALTS